MDDDSRRARGTDDRRTRGTDGTKAHGRTDDKSPEAHGGTDDGNSPEPHGRAGRAGPETHGGADDGSSPKDRGSSDNSDSPKTHGGTDDTNSPGTHILGGRQARWEQRTEVPLGVASLAFLAAYAIRVLASGLPQAALDLCLAVTLTAWALFAVDYAVRWRLSGQRLRFVRTHALDTVVLLLPLLRPLRVVKLYEAVQRRHGRPRLALHARVIVYAGMSALLLGFTGALAVYQQEHNAPGTTMRTFGDAVWWACATLATVGYGDVVPVTPLGRLIAVGVMTVGLALLGAVTGTFASWLLQVFSREDDERPPGN